MASVANWVALAFPLPSCGLQFVGISIRCPQCQCTKAMLQCSPGHRSLLKNICISVSCFPTMLLGAPAAVAAAPAAVTALVAVTSQSPSAILTGFGVKLSMTNCGRKSIH